MALCLCYSIYSGEYIQCIFCEGDTLSRGLEVILFLSVFKSHINKVKAIIDHSLDF